MIATPYHLSRLLIAVQGHDDAGLAVEWGSALASALHLPVTLVHVIDETAMNGSLHEAKGVAGDLLALLATAPPLQRADVSTSVLTGPVAAALSAKGLEEPGSILMFVAFPGPDGPEVLGHRMESLIQELASPFIVVPAGSRPPERIRRIVVGMDQSELASTVLGIARRVARSLDVDVIPVEAIEPGTMPADEFVEVQQVIAADHVRLRGLASRVLLASALAHDASIIAVGSHGAGASHRRPTGSTSEWLSQHSDRPVLIVPDVHG